MELMSRLRLLESKHESLLKSHQQVVNLCTKQTEKLKESGILVNVEEEARLKEAMHLASKLNY